MRPPEDYTNLFLDMNAFFASVEQQVQPDLRGKPVCVAPYTGGTGCCIAKSYEAKDYGISTGHLVGEAKKLCPELIVLESRPELYLFYHKEILKVLENFSPSIQPLSIDEFNIKLSGREQNKEYAVKLAKEIKKAIYAKVGDYLSCSIGISASPWLAKVSGELKKPNGLVALELKNLPALYKKLSLLDLPGINFAMKRQLEERKIKTTLEFFQTPLVNLSLWFGHPGRAWYYRLRGYETEGSKSPTKSIGHQHVLAPKYRTKFAARRVLAKMAQKCAYRLRKKNLYTGAIGIYINFLGAPSFRKSIKTNLISDSQTIQKLTLKAYDQITIRQTPFRIGVTLFNLSESHERQVSLFREYEKLTEISKTIDKINDRFGDDTIYPASMFDSLDAAPNRIPFGNPERLEF